MKTQPQLDRMMQDARQAMKNRYKRFWLQFVGFRANAPGMPEEKSDGTVYRPARR